MLLKSIATLALLVPAFADSDPSGLTVHEWGTFTSVAAEDGPAVLWVSLAPPADLPCFVNHLSMQCVKCGPARVRMETPVVYFYSPQPLTASVHVDLPSGLISEWYPQADVTSRLGLGYTYMSEGNINWSRVEVQPGAAPEFPNDGSASHYYAARQTDAAALRVGEQAEKVLFYRGIANFKVPVEPRFSPDGKLEIRNTDKDPIAFAMLFENRRGKVGFRVMRDLRGEGLADPPELGANLQSVREELAQTLVVAGLYPKEAAAMIETWHDSWFEEGMRVFYLTPRRIVDAELPIRISPKPETLERVFVGRVEVLSPAMRETLQTALEAGDTNTLARCKRFLGPWKGRISSGRRLTISRAAEAFLREAQEPPKPVSTSPCRTEPLTLPTEQR
jgi:hypothetical protein